MLDQPDMPHWPTIMRPLANASTALGALAITLKRTSLHQAWLWRETARMAARISQYSGHRVRVDRLMQQLAGITLEPAEDDTGLAAARRIFLIAAPLMRLPAKVESDERLSELFQPLWAGEAPEEEDPAEKGDGAGALLIALVREIASFAGDATRPALIDLLLEIRKNAHLRRLPANEMRLVLPLVLQQNGVLPKVSPALLGGRLSLRSDNDEPVTSWLVRALHALEDEARGATERLLDLTLQHQAWHMNLAKTGLRSTARTPAVLDLLAATPVLSATLVARHIGCSVQGASAMLKRLVDLGILSQATARSRWMIYLACDLSRQDRDPWGAGEGISLSQPAPDIDRDAIEETLDGLFAELDSMSNRVAKAIEAEKR